MSFFPLSGVSYNNNKTPAANAASMSRSNLLTFLTPRPANRTGLTSAAIMRTSASTLFSSIHSGAVRASDTARPRSIKVAVTVGGMYALGFQKKKPTGRASALLGAGRAGKTPTLPGAGVLHALPMVRQDPGVWKGDAGVSTREAKRRAWVGVR
jgi:hypothetical protein